MKASSWEEECVLGAHSSSHALTDVTSSTLASHTQTLLEFCFSLFGTVKTSEQTPLCDAADVLMQQVQQELPDLRAKAVFDPWTGK